MSHLAAIHFLTQVVGGGIVIRNFFPAFSRNFLGGHRNFKPWEYLIPQHLEGFKTTICGLKSTICVLNIWTSNFIKICENWSQISEIIFSAGFWLSCPLSGKLGFFFFFLRPSRNFLTQNCNFSAIFFGVHLTAIPPPPWIKSNPVASFFFKKKSTN